MSLEKYSENFPELKKSFTDILKILEGIEAVQEHDLADPKVLWELYNKVNRLFQYTLIGLTRPSEQQTTSGFVNEQRGAMILYTITKKLYTSHLLTTAQAKESFCVHTNNNATDAETNLATACLTAILSCLQNFSDAHDGFSLACGETGMISLYLDMCERIIADRTDPSTGKVTLCEESRKVVERSTNVVYNLSRQLGNRAHFCSCNATAALLRFSKLPQSIVGFEIPVLSLLSLAYLVDENNNHLIMTDDSLIEFLIDLLDKAVTSDDRRCEGFSTIELADGLTHVAVNDSNKMGLGKKGAVRVLLKMIQQSNDEQEQVSATKALWTLAFEHANKVLIEERGGIDVLKSLQERQSPALCKAAAGALWEISGKQERNTRGLVANEHVMISYQWDVQPTVVELKERLQSTGYKVWLDLEEMGGSTLEAMAKAVEKASVVLVCVSQKYKASPNCRSEAEYAYQKRKVIIPLMMEENYTPDGWLGIILGTKLWYEFWRQDTIHASTEKLKKELDNRGKIEQQIKPSVQLTHAADQVDSAPRPASIAGHAAASPSNTATAPAKPNVSEWTTEEVQSWLRKIGLHDKCRKVVRLISGQTLVSLHELRKECPEYFYRSLEKDLHLQNVFNVFTFRDELSKLFD